MLVADKEGGWILLIDLTPFRFSFGNPIPPLSPLPLLRGRGNGYIREASPLFNSALVSLSLKGEGEGGRGIGYETTT
jgi:hypothetical protein